MEAKQEIKCIQHSTSIRPSCYCYQRTDKDSFRNFLRYAYWGEIFNLLVENCDNVIPSWVKTDNEAFFPAWKHQVKP